MYKIKATKQMSKQSSSSEDGSLNIAFFSVLVVSLFLLFIFTEGEALPKEGEKETAVLSAVHEDLKEEVKEDEVVAIEGENVVLANSSPTYQKPQTLGSLNNEKEKEEENFERRWVRITAYAPLDPNALEGMCYSGDPRVTASGTTSREGIVAANFLPFGTKIRVPALFGDRVFTVEDRMSSRFKNTVDVVVSSQREAINFGAKDAYIEILR